MRCQSIEGRFGYVGKSCAKSVRKLRNVRRWLGRLVLLNGHYRLWYLHQTRFSCSSRCPHWLFGLGIVKIASSQRRGNCMLIAGCLVTSTLVVPSIDVVIDQAHLQDLNAIVSSTLLWRSHQDLVCIELCNQWYSTRLSIHLIGTPVLKI